MHINGIAHIVLGYRSKNNVRIKAVRIFCCQHIILRIGGLF